MLVAAHYRSLRDQRRRAIDAGDMVGLSPPVRRPGHWQGRRQVTSAAWLTTGSHSTEESSRGIFRVLGDQFRAKRLRRV